MEGLTGGATHRRRACRQVTRRRRQGSATSNANPNPSVSLALSLTLTLVSLVVAVPVEHGGIRRDAADRVEAREDCIRQRRRDYRVSMPKGDDGVKEGERVGGTERNEATFET